MPQWLAAGGWGLLAGAALVIGAAAGAFLRVPSRLNAAVMAFGSGVLISALAFELMAEAYAKGGFAASAAGLIGGAVVYTLANVALAAWGARHRKRSGAQQPSETQAGGSGLAIAVGSLLDGVPESMVIGLSLLEGGGVSLVTVAAIFLSNLPEGLSSATGMRRAGRSLGYVFGVWSAIAVASGIAAIAGNVLFAHAGAGTVAAITAVAAGAILAMIADTMLPEAVEGTGDYTGLITVAGFLVSFVLSHVAG
jgi:ZIP family zinc transporter